MIIIKLFPDSFEMNNQVLPPYTVGSGIPDLENEELKSYKLHNIAAIIS